MLTFIPWDSNLMLPLVSRKGHVHQVYSVIWNMLPQSGIPLASYWWIGKFVEVQSKDVPQILEWELWWPPDKSENPFIKVKTNADGWSFVLCFKSLRRWPISQILQLLQEGFHIKADQLMPTLSQSHGWEIYCIIVSMLFLPSCPNSLESIARGNDQCNYYYQLQEVITNTLIFLFYRHTFNLAVIYLCVLCMCSYSHAENK